MADIKRLKEQFIKRHPEMAQEMAKARTPQGDTVLDAFFIGLKELVDDGVVEVTPEGDIRFTDPS